MALKDVIKEYREKRGLGQAELARLTGLSQGYISKLEKGNYKDPGADVFLKLARALKIKLEEIYAAAGYTSSKFKTLRTKDPEEVLKELATVIPIRIPIIGSIPAGPAANFEQKLEDYVTIPRNELKTSSKKLFGLRVVDNSLLSGDIHSGDLLIIEPTQDISEGRIYILRINHELVVRPAFKQKEMLKPVSSDGQNAEIAASGFEILGRVILVGGWKEL